MWGYFSNDRFIIFIRYFKAIAHNFDGRLCCVAFLMLYELVHANDTDKDQKFQEKESRYYNEVSGDKRIAMWLYDRYDRIDWLYQHKRKHRTV